MVNLQISFKIITYISIYIYSKEERSNLQCHYFAVIDYSLSGRPNKDWYFRCLLAMIKLKMRIHKFMLGGFFFFMFARSLL